MKNKLGFIVALTAVLAPGMANAIGFGEITVLSRIGAPLMAEVPIVNQTGDAPVAACFSMAALRASDLPVVPSAKPRLIRRGQTYILQITSIRPVNEPIFAIGIRAGCGYDVEREYILMPEPPLELAHTSSPAIDAPVTRKSGSGATWQTREGETLEDIAAARAPNNQAERQRQLAALKRANPDLDELAPLPEGTLVQLPSRKRTPAPARETTETSAPQAGYSPPSPAHKTPPPARKNQTAGMVAGGGSDRLMLGTADDELRPPNKNNPGSTPMAEAEERLLRLETTLHLLSQEMEKMDQAIDLAAKALEAQHRLQLAQGLQQAPQANAPTVAGHVPPSRSSGTNWLDLALSAAVGAGISVGMAQYLGRRRRYPGDGEMPLAFSGYRSEVAPSVPPQAAAPVVAAMASLPSAQRSADLPGVAEDFAAPVLPDIELATQPEPEVIEAHHEDDDSVLALAEIMLSFGRIRGAAETLAEHIEEVMPQSIEPWSMLLDLYRRGGMREEFEALAVKMRERFNARILDWNDSTTPITGLKTLEDFPHVIHKASRHWGTQEGVNYLFSLVHDTRAGQRNGFPLEVVEEIALLLRILVDGYGLQRPR